MNDFDELDRMIDLLGKAKASGDKVLMRALTRMGERIVGDAKKLAPVDTGQMRQKIHVETYPNSLSVYAVSPAEYSECVEYGTGAMGSPEVAHTSKQKWTYYSPKLGRYVTTSGHQAQPFFWPAVAKHQARAESVLGAEIDKEITKELNGGK